MNWAITLAIAVNVLNVSFCVWIGGFRNWSVCNERRRIMARISAGASADIDSRRPWRWRYEQFQNGPSYAEMLCKFWRPVDSFFTDPATWEPPQ